MFYKYRTVPNVSRTMQSTFGGLNKNARIKEGEFADMQNMTGDAYPLLSPRERRTVAQPQIEDKNLNGILGDVGFAAVWGNDFYYMGNKVEGITLADSEKKLLAMGTSILIFPDTVWYDTANGEYGSMETGGVRSGTVTFDDESFTYENLTVGQKMDVEWNGLAGAKLYPFFVSDGFRNVVMTDRRIFYEDGTSGGYATRLPVKKSGGEFYYMYDGESESLSGYREKIYKALAWRKLPVKSITLDSAPVTGDLVLWAGKNKVNLAGNTLIFEKPGYIGDILTNLKNDENNHSKKTATYSWTAKNFLALDHVCVHDNRLWGCRYGEQINGKTVNEIYCSTLGNFKDWNTGTGANNAYTLSVGEYGEFTGCVSLRGQLLFFKENVVYRVSGDKPSNFRVDKISDNGLQEGCERSLEIIDGILYYKSLNGIFAYDGSIPQKISDALGNFYYTDAVAGKHFSKYYITMMCDGVRKMYVYDTRTGIWHAEDGAGVRFFTEYEGALYGAVDNNILCLSGTPAPIFTATEAEPQVEWSVETGDIGLDNPYQKYYRRVLIRMDIELGSRVWVEVSCNSGEWQRAADFTSSKKQSFIMPIITERCDHMRLRICGKGYAKIYSISYETETVGDRQN